ncbi:hypothetical protein B0I35DRAFT_115126 [Stachybotrys elegans]|uniref:Uncharacterized protein n=1 Tax=Stachybotrys elegans TaxID=80388 RepID=A0A8K0SEH3_9HYPO|nr:hypothetical protein B0I35DRAFT_115126 [Stachybotrys elegans]
MAANHSSDAVKRMEEARDGVGAQESPLEKNDCYFKVIDMQADGQAVHDRGGCYSFDGLDQFYNRIPPQPVNSIRVILDGRPQPNIWGIINDPVDGDSYPRCRIHVGFNHFDPSRTCPLYSTEVKINPLDFYYLPTLRKLLAMEPRAGWYGIRSFAEHPISNCPNAREYDVLQPMEEDCSMHLTACRNRDDLISLICYAPNAHIAKRFRKCANASWRLLEELSLSLQKVGFLRLANGRETQALQFLIIHTLALNLETMMGYIQRAHIQRLAWLFQFTKTSRLVTVVLHLLL